MSFLNQKYSELILASTSPARQTLLSTLGVPFRVEPPGVDEEVSATLSVREMVATLAERKARAVFRRFPEALVVGSDQLVSVDGASLGKPNDASQARVQLTRLSGRSHQVLTAVGVIGAGYFSCEVETARMTMFDLDEDEITRCLALEEWRGCAGGYRIEGRSQALFSSVEGDRAAVQGLPMARVIRLLREAGLSFFWPSN